MRQFAGIGELRPHFLRISRKALLSRLAAVKATNTPAHPFLPAVRLHCQPEPRKCGCGRCIASLANMAAYAFGVLLPSGSRLRLNRLAAHAGTHVHCRFGGINEA